MKATELLETLRKFHKDKLTMLRRHVAVARHVSDYDFNNTYKYVIAREEMHVSWAVDAVQDVSADLGQGEATIPLIDDGAEPQVTLSGKGAAAEAEIIRQDAASAQGFVDTWRPIVASLTHARHRTMLNVILGETLEHKRFFDQAVAGRTDLLGRRADGAGTGGGVLPVRWIEQ